MFVVVLHKAINQHLTEIQHLVFTQQTSCFRARIAVLARCPEERYQLAWSSVLSPQACLSHGRKDKLSDSGFRDCPRPRFAIAGVGTINPTWNHLQS